MPATLITAPSGWTVDDAQELRNLLSTPFGRRLAFRLSSFDPPVEGVTPERILGRIEGYRFGIDYINTLADSQYALSLAASNAASGDGMYPDLDSDDKWPATLGGTASTPAPKAIAP